MLILTQDSSNLDIAHFWHFKIIFSLEEYPFFNPSANIFNYYRSQELAIGYFFFLLIYKIKFVKFLKN